MTFIVGIIYKKAVHIIADSAESITYDHITDTILPEEFQSSMFESAVINDGNLVFENAQKIYHLKGQVLAGFAGNVREGLEIIREFNCEIEEHEDLRSFVVEFFATRSPRTTQNIIGFMHQGISSMFCYHGPGRNWGITQELSVCSIGTNEWIPVEEMNGMITAAANEMMSKDDFLQNIIVTIQVITQQLLTFQKGVGGHINGVYVDISGVHWARDIIYLFLAADHSGRPETTHHIWKYNRDDAVFLRSNHHKELFVSELSELTPSELADKWNDELGMLSNSYQADYFLLYAYDKSFSFLINNINDNPCKVLSINGNVAFSPVLHQYWKHYLENGAEFNVPILHVTNLIAEN